MQRKVIFAYRIGQKNMGGKAMRVDQLAAMAQDHLSDRYSFQIALAPKSTRPLKCQQFIETCQDAVVIFHKSAAANLGSEFRAALRKSAAGVCLDHLDIVAGPFERGFVDIHLAASYESERFLFQGLPALNPAPGTIVRHLRHHSDPRLAPATTPTAQFKLGYFGLPDNVVLPPELIDEAIVPEYSGTGDVSAFIARLHEANFHICTRDPSPALTKGILSSKPFTKGFNAAVVGANVLVNRQVHDAEFYLGEDYPYFIDDTDTTSILNGITRAANGYGGDEWRLAQSRMKDMAAQITAKEVTSELDKILRLF